MAVLYQKFRPQTFAEVIGQEPIIQTLTNATKSGDLAHAYLFTGSRGVGKTTIARLLAKAANCTSLKDGNPCGKCNVCLSVANGSALDIIEIDAASHTGVDNVRELIEHAQFRPTSMAMKVFIIDEVHMLSKAAFNALLKTLEEPPKHAMFILATTDIEKVPETIASRTQRFDFKRITPVEMSKAVSEIAKSEKIKLPEGVINIIVAQSEGSMRDALSRLGMVASLGDKITLEDAERLLGVTSIETIQDLITQIIAGNSSSFPEFFETAFSKGSDATVFNRGVLLYLQKLLNAKLTGSADESELMAQHIAGFSIQNLLFTIRLFLRSFKEITTAPSPELPLLLAAIEASLAFSKAAAPASTTVAAPASAPATAPTSLSSAPVANTPKASQAQEVEETFPNDTSVTIEQIQDWWPEVISRIKVDNSPIATLLKNSPIIEVKDGKIIVAVKYLFHKEHIDNKKHNSMIVESITAVSGKNLSIKAVISKDSREAGLSQTVDALADALKVFGGELVE